MANWFTNAIDSAGEKLLNGVANLTGMKVVPNHTKLSDELANNANQIAAVKTIKGIIDDTKSDFTTPLSKEKALEGLTNTLTLVPGGGIGKGVIKKVTNNAGKIMRKTDSVLGPVADYNYNELNQKYQTTNDFLNSDFVKKYKDQGYSDEQIISALKNINPNFNDVQTKGARDGPRYENIANGALGTINALANVITLPGQMLVNTANDLGSGIADIVSGKEIGTTNILGETINGIADKTKDVRNKYKNGGAYF